MKRSRLERMAIFYLIVFNRAGESSLLLSLWLFFFCSTFLLQQAKFVCRNGKEPTEIGTEERTFSFSFLFFSFLLFFFFFFFKKKLFVSLKVPKLQCRGEAQTGHGNSQDHCHETERMDQVECQEEEEKKRVFPCGCWLNRFVSLRRFPFSFIDFHDDKVVYRRYAGLYFCLCVDRSANELATLELIHLFVETLDNYFGSVCELDLVFNFFNCIQLWDEMCIGGEPVETSKKELLNRMSLLKMVKKKKGRKKNCVLLIFFS